MVFAKISKLTYNYISQITHVSTSKQRKYNRVGGRIDGIFTGISIGRLGFAPVGSKIL